jgi:DNA-binding transcriptional LysR family regulator
MITNINLNLLNVFDAVYTTQSMTLAAQKLRLTQSGVSQHIQTLEEMLDLPLFDRVRRKLLATEHAHRLHKRCHPVLEELDKSLREITGADARLAGTVRIGTPIEFGNNIVMPKLAEFSRKNADVNVRLTYSYANEMNEALLHGDLDFALVDEFRMHPQIQKTPVYTETLALCASENYLKGKRPFKESIEFFESLDYVDFQPGGPLARQWFSHHYKRTNLHLKIRVSVVDVQALSRLILSGAGAGILPGHLVDKIDPKNKALYLFDGSGKPLRNQIYLARLKDRTLSPAAQALMKDLQSALGDGAAIN